MSSDERSPSDAQLVAATLAGDREAFGRLYDRHARAVRAVVLAVSGDWATVDDMTQESFLRGYRKLATLGDPDKFRLWITAVARHVARERRRALTRDRHEFADALTALVDNRDTTSRTAQREQLNIVVQALQHLTEQERLAIHAFYFESQNVDQAAELLGLSRSGFYALLKRATARLAARVGSPVHKEHR